MVLSRGKSLQYLSHFFQKSSRVPITHTGPGPCLRRIGAWRHFKQAGETAKKLYYFEASYTLPARWRRLLH